VSIIHTKIYINKINLQNNQNKNNLKTIISKQNLKIIYNLKTLKQIFITYKKPRKQLGFE